MKKHSFCLDKEIYSKNVLIRATYAFIDMYYVNLDAEMDGKWGVTLKTKDSSPIRDVNALEGEFQNILINETFRDQLMEKTRLTKELIVAKALFGADRRDDLVNEDPIHTADATKENEDFSFIDQEIDDYLDDPLGIAIPWEEKYKKNKQSSTE